MNANTVGTDNNQLKAATAMAVAMVMVMAKGKETAMATTLN